ncbi:hypothetical protein CYMTET_37030 [Cymbomonas tetramitiformis]|uniref:Uncharacterized protein n=1 Tax=Cymbomonas tetramitiformis TaxID=36881 RepID=A0AAE0CGX5_9CHLO|nr:hypothetical protein CYMTET_37030 [Cymbomonas tetramitiformis]
MEMRMLSSVRRFTMSMCIVESKFAHLSTSDTPIAASAKLVMSMAAGNFARDAPNPLTSKKRRVGSDEPILIYRALKVEAPEALSWATGDEISSLSAFELLKRYDPDCETKNEKMYREFEKDDKLLRSKKAKHDMFYPRTPEEWRLYGEEVKWDEDSSDEDREDNMF